jgi:methyl-accepting chemotaxis protein
MLLFIFLAAVVVTWSDLSFVRSESYAVSQTVVPTVAIATQVDRSLSRLALSTLRLQNAETTDETKAAIEEVKADLKSVQDANARLIAAGKANPDLQTPKAFQTKVLPAYTQYEASIEKTIALLGKKMANFNAQSKSGGELSAVTAQFTPLFYESLKKAAQSGGSGEEIERRAEAYRMTTEIATALQNVRLAMYRAALTNNTKAMSAILDMTPPIKKSFEELKAISDQPQELELLDRMVSTFLSYENDLKLQIGTFVEMASVADGRAPQWQTISTESANLGKLAMERVDTVAKENVENVHSSIILLISCAVAIFVLGLVLAFVISRSITRPLSRIVTLAGRFQEGDLTVRREDFSYDSRDEMGNLSTVLCDMVSSQEDVMKQVISVADELTEGAGSLASIAEETDKSMEMIKLSIEQITALSQGNATALEQSNVSVEKVSAGVEAMAQSAKESADFIAMTTKVSAEAVQKVGGVIIGMREVGKNSKENAEKLQRLVESVKNVSSFVSVITNIANQTNLLALNAAIEAARAGEAGRGFAVVAEEVRKLAEESGRAAKSVDKTILELQNDARESISATTEADRLLNDTLDHAHEAQKKLAGALREINKANGSIQNIAAVAQAQAGSGKEVAEAIDHLTKATMATVDKVEQIRRTAEETAQSVQGVTDRSEVMSDHARQLMEVLGRFQLQEPSELSKTGKTALPARA